MVASHSLKFFFVVCWLRATIDHGTYRTCTVAAHYKKDQRWLVCIERKLKLLSSCRSSIFVHSRKETSQRLPRNVHVPKQRLLVVGTKYQPISKKRFKRLLGPSRYAKVSKSSILVKYCSAAIFYYSCTHTLFYYTRRSQNNFQHSNIVSEWIRATSCIRRSHSEMLRERRWNFQKWHWTTSNANMDSDDEGGTRFCITGRS
jgi:hypothetical protein